MFVIVDGTGPVTPSAYYQAMQGSFCHQIYTRRQKDAIYHRGPAGIGLTNTISSKLVAQIEVRYGLQPDEPMMRANAARYVALPKKPEPMSPQEPLYLAGYSRGGACVLDIAHRLYASHPKLVISGVFLFDPVTRDPTLKEKVAPNIQEVYVAYRDLSIPVKNKMPVRRILTAEVLYPVHGGLTAIAYSFLQDDLDLDIHRRGWMENTSVELENAARTKMERTVAAKASHGAAGGCPWPDRPDDLIGMAAVATFMNTPLKKLGVNLYIPETAKQLYRK